MKGKLARKIGGNLALAQLELEKWTGAAVEDDQLADVIASNLASHGHPTATAPMGGPRTVGGRVLASHPQGDPRTSCRRHIDHAGRSIGGDETPTTIMIAERIAKGVYATDGTLGDVPVLEIAAAAPAGSRNHRNQVTAAHRDGH